MILQALLRAKKRLDEMQAKDRELEASLARAIEVYEDAGRILDLIARFSYKELIEILETKRR
ncbi:MAG: hypothetical protein BWY13_01295 [Euryarchaeota archaeon ADurb.Bin190]|nr:MAG: hypothetical protein BWY13_01295 [Euryarchaeota archaeon ADurb.Bin190]